MADSRARYMAGSRGWYMADSRARYMADSRAWYMTDCRAWYMADSRAWYMADSRAWYIPMADILARYMKESRARYICKAVGTRERMMQGSHRMIKLLRTIWARYKTSIYGIWKLESRSRFCWQTRIYKLESSARCIRHTDILFWGGQADQLIKVRAVCHHH